MPKKNHKRELIEIQAVARPNRKRRGEAAEAAFFARAASLGFSVLKPWGESGRYDLAVDSGHGFWRVQVKSTECYAEHRYRVKAAGWKATYTRDEIDFFAALVVPDNLWYIVPIQAVGSRKGLRFYPHSRPKSKGDFERYREAWCLLDCSLKARGWKDIPILCRCKELAVRCAVCPRIS
jgi:hypothetical protein